MAGPARARPSWSDWPSVSTLIRAQDIEVWDAGLLSLKTDTYRASDFGTVGDGVTNDQAALQSAIDTAHTANKHVAISPGTYLINGDLTIPTGMRLFSTGRGAVTITNCQLRIEGSNGSEVNITSAVAKGASTVAVSSTTGMAAGDWIRLVSVINSNSSDAGVDQLGGRKADNSFLSEFARIKSVDSSTQITLEGQTIWPYSITAGTDSGTRTTSTVIPITFNERVRIEGIKFTGRSSTNTQVVNVSLARDCRLIDCEVDTNGALCFAARMSYSLDSHFHGGRYTGASTATTSSHNVIIIRSSTNCSVRDGARVDYGFQGIDVTYGVTDTSLWGGPSIACDIRDVSAKGQVNDAFTDHPGVFRTVFENVRAYGAVRGIRLRGRGSQAIGAVVTGHTTNGIIGILVEGGFTAGWAVQRCSVEGFSVGIESTPDETTSTSRPTVNGTASGRIVDNHLNGCVTGIECASPATANALIHAVQIERNTLRNISSNPIYVSAYCNGIEVQDNSIHSVASGKAGVTYEANVKRLRVGRNFMYDVNAAGFAVKGPGTASFITDTTTFPSGNAEAYLFIDAQVTDAATAFSGIIRDATAFITLKPAGWAGFTSPISTQIPADADLERNSIAFYLDGTPNVQAKFKDATGVVFTKAVT